MKYDRLTEPVTVRNDDKRLTNKTRPDMSLIPEGLSGDFEIVHRKTFRKEKMKVLDGGYVNVPEGANFTILRRASTRRVWMSDTPMEVDSMKAAAKHAKGDVLVLGLGLGIFPRLATKAKTITVVELEDDVAALAWKHIADDRMTLLMGDAKVVMEKLAAEGRTFDFVYADIWDGTDSEYLPFVNWYLDYARANLLTEGGEVMAWGYDKMVRALTKDAVEIAVMEAQGRFADEDKRKGAKERWPVTMLAADYMRDAMAKGERPSLAAVTVEADRLARTIVSEPEYLEDLIDRNVRKIDAAGIGLPEPGPRVMPDAPKKRSAPPTMSQLLGLPF